MTDLLVNPEPIFRVDGSARGELTRAALEVTVEETTHGLRTLSLSVLAQGPASDAGAIESLLFLDGDPIDFGKSIEVSLGGDGQARKVFEGSVSGIEAEFRETSEPSLRVFAEDKLMLLRMTRRSRTYQNVSDADIAREIGSLNSLDVDADSDGPSYEYVQQWNQSDLAFLRSRAELTQAEVWFRDGKLYFKSRGKRAATELTLVHGNELLSLDVRADLAHQRTSVRVSGYDAGQRSRIEKIASSEAIQAELAGGRTGISVLQNAFGERASLRVRDVPLTDSEAEDFARAEMLRRARRFVTASGVTSGTPELEVGSKLTLERVGRPFSGSGYYVTRVCHRWSRMQGFRTHFEAERPTLSEAS